MATVLDGREALARRAWDEAVSAFTTADREQELSPDDLQLLAEAAWWAGRPDDAVEALERAFAGYERAGDHIAAAIVAVRLAELAVRRLAHAVAQGWLARAERLLADQPESPAHAWLAFVRLAEALHVRHDPDAAIAHADEAIVLSHRFDDPDVRSLAQAFKGSALLMKGRISEGMALIDEATAAATSGEIEPRSACNVYCHTIAACRDLGDYGRAAEWTDRAERFMQRRSIQGYPGICRVHRAELKRLRGWWPDAEQEARHACDELQRFRLLDGVGMAHYEIGEVRLHVGDLDAAEEAFQRAFEYGRLPQPGLALLLLARGRVDDAASSIARALDGDPSSPEEGRLSDPLARARLLPAQLEIALARDDVEVARAAADELEAIAERQDSPVWQASALTCRGALHLHEGRPERAVPVLDRAWRLWRDVDLPYDSARARLLLARARAAVGDDTTARLELRAVRAAFQRLGAAPDLRVVDELLGDEAARTGRQRLTRTFLFSDIVTSTDLVGLIGDEAWEDLLRWHDQTLRSTFARHDGEEVSHTGDGFFVVFDRPADAIACAVDVQRRLADHRRRHGFAPWVRIGLHTAEATRDGTDYRGQAVHVAARIGALAGKEQIVASAAAIGAAGPLRFPVSEPRSVRLRGVSDEIEVVDVDWR